MTRTLLAAACAATTIAGSAYAVSPYDLPYGLQWSFQAGDAGTETAGGLDVTADGVVHVYARAGGTQTFGQGATGSINSDIGGISPRGNLVYGITVASLPGHVGSSQNYPSGVHAIGNKAYFDTYSNNTSHWNDPGSIQDPVAMVGKMGNSPMIWSIDSSALDKTGQLNGNASLTTAIDDRNAISLFQDNGLTFRSDGKEPLVPGGGLQVPGTQLRSIDSAMRKSAAQLIIVGDMVIGDFATAGDYEGNGLRTNGTQPAYLPSIGRYNYTTNTLDGPAKMPILTSDTNLATWSNMGSYNAAGVDENSGWYYGGGLSHSRAESTSNAWDPDGSGAAPSISFVNSFRNLDPAGIGSAYNSSNVLQYAVTWDEVGFDIITAVTGVGDGTNRSLWGGEKGDDAYFEMRDAAGAVLWSKDLDLSLGTDAERVRTIDVIDSEIYVAGYFANSAGGAFGDGSGLLDSFIAKFDLAGNEIWKKFVAGGGNETTSEAASAGKLKTYVYSNTDGSWANNAGYLNPGGTDILLQKLVPGDFNSDGAVDSADITLLTAAVAAPQIGVDTYDFNEDNNSTKVDVAFFLYKVLDKTPDLDGDGDIDDADFGIAFASFTGPGAGNPGYNPIADFDADGDTDDADFGIAFSAFTGPGGTIIPEPTSLALLGLGGLMIARRRRA